MLDARSIPANMIRYFEVKDGFYVLVPLGGGVLRFGLDCNPYICPGAMELTPAQYKTMDGLILKKAELVHNRGMTFEEAVKSRVLRYLIDREIVGIPMDDTGSLSYILLTETFNREKKEHELFCKRNGFELESEYNSFGIYLPEGSEINPEKGMLRPLIFDSIATSRLLGNIQIVSDDFCVIGIYDRNTSLNKKLEDIVGHQRRVFNQNITYPSVLSP